MIIPIMTCKTENDYQGEFLPLRDVLAAGFRYMT
jgi:hypothetical protein